MIFRTSLLAAAVLALGLSAAPARGQTVIPQGNSYAEQPAVPGASAKRTSALKTTYEKKYRKVFDLLAGDGKLRAKIKDAASAYGIDPMHIVGAIVGEHTYNVDAYDRLQTYYVKAASYLGNSLSFSYEGEDIAQFLERPEFAQCEGKAGSYAVWACRESVWNESFRGKTVGGTSFPNDRFSATFFQPLYAGQTFGIGQLNPLTALQMSDTVAEVSGLPKLDYRNAHQVYETIMDPDLTLTYVAATLKHSIDAYRDIAGFDISRNPGLTATLYNVGDPEGRARALKAENHRRRAAGEIEKLPEENYYGWLVNEKLPELKGLL